MIFGGFSGCVIGQIPKVVFEWLEECCTIATCRVSSWVMEEGGKACGDNAWHQQLGSCCVRVWRVVVHCYVDVKQNCWIDVVAMVGLGLA